MLKMDIQTFGNDYRVFNYAYINKRANCLIWTDGLTLIIKKGSILKRWSANESSHPVYNVVL